MSADAVAEFVRVPVDWIVVGDRARKDMGDLDSLAESIEELGQLQPIGITSDNRLVFGGRRLEACRKLGLRTIDAVRLSNVDEALPMLRAERDENTCRKPMIPSELLALGERIHEIEAANADDRRREGNRLGAAITNGAPLGGSRPTERFKGKTRDQVGHALGMNGSTYAGLRKVYTVATDDTAPDDERQVAQDALERMDAGAALVSTSRKAHADIERIRTARQKAETVPPNTEKPGHPKTREDLAVRREQIQALADQGHTSAQIADHLGYSSPESLRAVARRGGISIPADKVMGRPRRHDSNRITRELTHTLEGAAMSINLIDRDALDTSEAAEWAASLKQSLATLRRFATEIERLTK